MNELIFKFTEYGFKIKEKCLFVVFVNSRNNPTHFSFSFLSPNILSGANLWALSFLGKISCYYIDTEFFDG